MCSSEQKANGININICSSEQRANCININMCSSEQREKQMDNMCKKVNCIKVKRAKSKC